MSSDALVVPRQEFIERRFTYGRGEHLSVFGPTGDGKTTLLFELLDEVARPELPAVNLVMKPRDPTVSRLSAKAGFKRVRSWPPSRVPTLFGDKPRGHTLWPKHTFDVQKDNENLWREFRVALLDSYKRGNRIVFADELYGLTHELGLSDEVNAIYTRGRAMGTGLWSATQRPAYVPRNAYSQATHVFLSPDPDREARKRYAEIGGMDPKLILHNLERCGRYQWVYVRRQNSNGPAVICIVDR